MAFYLCRYSAPISEAFERAGLRGAITLSRLGEGGLLVEFVRSADQHAKTVAVGPEMLTRRSPQYVADATAATLKRYFAHLLEEGDC